MSWCMSFLGKRGLRKTEETVKGVGLLVYFGGAAGRGDFWLYVYEYVVGMERSSEFGESGLMAEEGFGRKKKKQ